MFLLPIPLFFHSPRFHACIPTLILYSTEHRQDTSLVQRCALPDVVHLVPVAQADLMNPDVLTGFVEALAMAVPCPDIDITSLSPFHGCSRARTPPHNARNQIIAASAILQVHTQSTHIHPAATR